MRKIVFLFLLVTLPGAPAGAKDVDGEFAVFSVGGETCETYLRARQRGGREQQRYSEWVQGYLSAFNLIVANTYNILGQQEFDKAVRWLDEHCDENRQDPFVNATAALTVNLFPVRSNMAPDKDSRAKWTGTSTARQ